MEQTAGVPQIFSRDTGRRVTEDYLNFKEDVPLVPKPIQNWASEFGKIAAGYISELPKGESKTKVLMAHAGAGRTTLEVMRACRHLSVHHSDASSSNVQVLKDLLKNGKIQWNQQVEAEIDELHEYVLSEKELKDIAEDNEISYW